MRTRLNFKCLFIAILFAIFLWGFGIVSIQKFLARGVLMTASHERHPAGVHAPLITVCPALPESGAGWKDQGVIRGAFNNHISLDKSFGCHSIRINNT